MKENLESIHIIRALTNPESVKAGTPIEDVEKDFQEWVMQNATILLQKYKERSPEKHWKKGEEKNMRLGMCGQLAFQHLLDYLHLSYNADDPSQPVKPYDFKLSIGTVEIKTYDHYCKYTIVKESEWKGNDFVVVWKFTDETQNHLALKGWLTKQEVESYPIIPKGECPQTPLASARVIPMERLHDPKTFIEKLNIVRSP